MIRSSIAKNTLFIEAIKSRVFEKEGQIAKDDQAEAAIIFSWLSQIAKVKKLTNCILEASHFDLETRKELINNSKKEGKYLGLFYDLPLYAQAKNYQDGNLHFQFGDIQTGLIRNLSEFFTLFKDPLFGVPGAIKIFNKQIKGMVGEQSLEKYFEEVEKLKEQLSKKIADLKIPSHGQVFVENLLATINSKIAEWKSVLALDRYNVKQPFVDLFQEMDETSICPNSIHLHGFCWFYPISNALKSLGFIIEFFENINNFDQIIFFCGNQHAIVLQNFLKALGFSLIYQRGTLEDLPSKYKGPQISLEKFNAFLNGAFSDNFDFTALKLSEKEESKTEKDAICAQCKKTDASKRCARCKKVYYCSAECQKSHWKTHKSVCKLT